MSQANTIHQKNTAPSREKLMYMLTGQHLTQAISVAAKLGIADLLKDGAKSTDELAKSTGVNAQSLYRIMRALGSNGIFSEVDDGYFEINSLAKYLQSDFPGSIRDAAILEGAQWLWQGWGNMFDAVKTGISGFESHFGMSVIEYFKQNPEQFGTFRAGLNNYSTMINDAVLAAYDFPSGSKLIDLGGGDGSLLVSILETDATMTGVLFELPSVVARIQSSHVATGGTKRYEMLEGDFFTSIPTGGDIYVLKQIIHNWDDEQALKILRNCDREMSTNSRLLIIDPIVAAQEPSFATFLDLQLLITHPGASIRTQDRLAELVEKAGLQVTNIITTQSPCTITECRPG
jgi:O-methyltransferase domain